jgi:hypothetical protein
MRPGGPERPRSSSCRPDPHRGPYRILLYQSRLVPRWLSAWGLVGAALYVVPPLGSMFGLSLGVLMAPLAVQEMVMAVWLIAKGFIPSAIASESAGETSRWQTAAPSTVPATWGRRPSPRDG